MEPVIIESRFKMVSKWASLIKDIFSSIKDGGIIIFVLALILFKDPFLKFFEDHHIKVQSVNVLGGIQMAVTSLTAVAEAQPIQVSSDPSNQMSALESSPKLTEQVLQIEQAALTSHEAVLIKDWAVIIAGFPELQASQVAVEKITKETGKTPSIFKKRNSYRIVVQIGNKDEVDAALKSIREHYPASYLVSLAAWCGDYANANGFISCSAT